ncbi:MAG: nitroreductase [Methanohalobium sp.]|uniref:nitroreductase n=1 Tax=Methanohalobium sp. TaxID=2837493 RepID=UPI00397E0E72
MAEENENPVIDAIKSRRSIRDYLDKQVPEDTVNKVIDAGIHAPTALGLQPWNFVVIEGKDIIKEISDHIKPMVQEHIKDSTEKLAMDLKEKMKNKDFNLFYGAPILVLVMHNRDDTLADYDCALCAENMMLAAHSMGLGSCWVGAGSFIQQSPELLDDLDITHDFKIVAPIILGYPNNIPPGIDRCEPMVSWIYKKKDKN